MFLSFITSSTLIWWWLQSFPCWNLLQSSLAAGRLTSGVSSITLIVSGGILIQLMVVLWLLFFYRLILPSNFTYWFSERYILHRHKNFDNDIFLLLNLILQCGQWHTRYDYPTSHRGIMGDWRWSAKHTAQCVARNSIQTWFGTCFLRSPLTSELLTNISKKYINMWPCLLSQEGAFAQLKLWQSASIAVVFFISTTISFQAMLVIMLVSLLISMAGFLYLTLIVERALAGPASWIRMAFRRKL